MLKTLAAACTATLLSVVVVPAAGAAEPSPVSVGLEARDGMRVDENGVWHAEEDGALFGVWATNVGDENLDEATVFVSVPDEIELISINNWDWECWDVDGGIECHNSDVVAPDEAWDPLLVLVNVNREMEAVDSIDAYVTTGDHDEAHAGVPFHAVA